ncbi:hypothetical protein RBWH47_05116 [Rhodopirellula baltica WH47]|uniref:Uncharacterized protein n=1 Tax=Rhodopirellula baltica WH47 TaxID=991778 RepID=F2AX80_RHOBT|nr:hypothetical protein RBWH47_05116 [Rhodopirellula baltica WH47]
MDSGLITVRGSKSETARRKRIETCEDFYPRTFFYALTTRTKNQDAAIAD